MDSKGGILVGLYLIISQIMSLVFLVEIAKSWDSVLAIIFFGPFLAEFKGLLWIFMIW